VAVATVALAIDAATALLTYRPSKDSMNIKAAFLHNVADALASLGVIVGGVIILLYDWTIVDPLLTLVIAGYVLWHGCSEIGAAIRILMLGAPDETEPAVVIEAMQALDGIADVHHVHLWRLDERRVSLEAHLVLEDGATPRSVKERVRAMLRQRFGIDHVTLETEALGEACQAAGGLPR
jgi:cobalt-zinc-cadmium efflux system protein